MNRSFIVRSGTALAALAAVAALAFGQDKVAALIKRVIEEGDSVNYAGRRVVEYKQGPELRRHTEQILRVGDRSRIDFPEGSPMSGQIVVEGKDKREHYFPDKNEILSMPPRRPEAFERLKFLLDARERGLKLRAEPGEEVAGRPTQTIVVEDRFGNKLQQLWVDNERPLVLRRAMFDPVGSRVGFFEFQTIDFDPRVPRGAFEIRRRGAKRLTLYDLVDRTAKEHDFLPLAIRDKSYQLDLVTTNSVQGKEVLVQLYAGEGDERFTLYQVKDGTLDAERFRRFGRGRANTHVWSRDGRTLALVGNVDKAKLEQLARLVAPR
ncbi:MAG: hypothetical protein KIS66_14150 [Fimbriimonadaceae bacterium]|nr:hypothetical protein [Fimbriimonadaceae bacterium]